MNSRNQSATDSSNNHEDYALVQLVRSGNHAAYQQLCQRYSERIYHMLLHLVNGDMELAQEFTQEAFVRAFERLDQYAGRSSFYTWLYRLARNRALDLLAKKKPQAIADEQLQRQATPAASAHNQVEQGELQALVQMALGELAPEQRELILLRDFDNWDYDQLAEHFACPLGTIKSRLNRARRALRAVLAPRLQGTFP